MALWLKQSTSVDVGIGPFLDSSDGFTAETGLTLTQPDIRLKKNSGNWAQKNAAQTLSHEENGWYELTLDTTDTNTLGILLVSVQESGALPVWHEFEVVATNVYNALIADGGVTRLGVDVKKWNGEVLETTFSPGVPVVGVKYWRNASEVSDLISGRVDCNVGAMQTNVITSGAIADNAINASKVADGTIDAATFASGAIDNAAFNVTETLTANPATSGITASSFSAGAIDAAAIAVDAIGASELAADAANEIADALLTRDMSAVSGEAARSLLNAIRKLMNKWSISGTVLTVTKEDDSTTAYTQNITSTPNADAITGLDTVE